MLILKDVFHTHKACVFQNVKFLKSSQITTKIILKVVKSLKPVKSAIPKKKF